MSVARIPFKTIIARTGLRTGTVRHEYLLCLPRPLTVGPYYRVADQRNPDDASGRLEGSGEETSQYTRVLKIIALSLGSESKPFPPTTAVLTARSQCRVVEERSSEWQPSRDFDNAVRGPSCDSEENLSQIQDKKSSRPIPYKADSSEARR